jgi:hypothetical protein
MSKSEQTFLYVALGAAALYYFMKNSAGGANPNAETATEAAQSAASTLQANLDATLGLS